MTMLEPQHRRLGKPGHIWPGVYKNPSSYTDKTRPWRFACPAPLCFFHGGYPTEAMARKMQETHTCPWYGGGKTTISRGLMSDMFLAPIWKKLDEAVDELMIENAKTPQERGHEYHASEEMAGRARGLSEALAILMPPFFSTGDEIAREALVRWEKRQAGEDYETPGIGRLRFKVPPAAELLTPSGIPHDYVAGTKHAPEYHPAAATKNYGLSDEKVAEIVKQSKAGFPTRMLATVHDTTEKIIDGILKANV